MIQRHFTDHQFAAYLRAKGAIDNFHQLDGVTATAWYAANSRLVAVAVYNNSTCEKAIFTEDGAPAPESVEHNP